MEYMPALAKIRNALRGGSNYGFKPLEILIRERYTLMNNGMNRDFMLSSIFNMLGSFELVGK